MNCPLHNPNRLSAPVQGKPRCRDPLAVSYANARTSSDCCRMNNVAVALQALFAVRRDGGARNAMPLRTFANWFFVFAVMLVGFGLLLNPSLILLRVI